MKKMGRPANIEAIKMVKKLKTDNPNLSYGEIKAILKAKMGEDYDRRTIQRWHLYPVA